MIYLVLYSGSHVNDDMNQPDSAGRVLVNVGHPPNEPDIFLAPQLAYTVKPHQVTKISFGIWQWIDARNALR